MLLFSSDSNDNFKENEIGQNYVFDFSSISIQENNSINISKNETDYQNDLLNIKDIQFETSDINNNLNIKLQFKVKKASPKLLSKDDIIGILNEKIHDNKEYIKIFNSNCKNSNEYIEKTMKEIKGTTVIGNQKNAKINNSGKNQLGRKTKLDTSVRSHNKYSPDNIINKIKNILKKQLIVFVNNIIKSLYNPMQINILLFNLGLPFSQSDYIIKDLDYKSFADAKKKIENLNFLELTLKEFLSQKISSRYKNIGHKDLSGYNKKIIKYLLDDRLGGINLAIFNFIFNELKIEDWLNIFIHKKELNDFSPYNLLGDKEKDIIEDSLVRIENLFRDLINEDEDGVYFTCFILLVYNYKRYYSVKNERNVTRKKNNK